MRRGIRRLEKMLPGSIAMFVRIPFFFSVLTYNSFIPVGHH